jgi:hypothetical protein
MGRTVIMIGKKYYDSLGELQDELRFPSDQVRRRSGRFGVTLLDFIFPI